MTTSMSTKTHARKGIRLSHFSDKEVIYGIVHAVKFMRVAGEGADPVPLLLGFPDEIPTQVAGDPIISIFFIEPL